MAAMVKPVEVPAYTVENDMEIPPDYDRPVIHSEFGARPQGFGNLLTDLELWSEQRLAALNSLRSQLAPPVIGTLDLPRQGTRIPVFAGASEVSMTLGAGHLSDSSPLSGNGNIVITSHRDGSFRVLKDLAIGDPLILKTGVSERQFVVTRQVVVTPDRVDVIDETRVPTLTLITCYPFYYVGSAPKRFVVHAELLNAEATEAAVFSGRLPSVTTEPDPVSPVKKRS